MCTGEPTPERLSLTDPCGVCVIQIPYGGSPAATQDGIPMKYSTLRSKTCLPSRCSRIARFVSRVIQFRRPISSLGPQGLFETFTPPRLRTGVGDELLVACHDVASFSVSDCLGLLDEGAVELGTPVAEEIELVLAWDHVVLVAGLLHVDLGDEQRLPGHSGLRKALAERIDDLAPAAELAPAFLADAVRGQQVDAVLGSARDRDQLGLALRGEREVRRVRDDVGALEGERPRDLREAQVVADLDADPAERRVVDGELVAGHGEAVDAEEGQVGLPVACRSGRPGRRGRPRSGARRRRARAGRRRRAARAGGTRAREPRSKARESPPRTCRPSSALSNMYPGIAHSGRTSSCAPAAAASSMRATHESRLRSFSPSCGSICATATCMPSRV